MNTPLRLILGSALALLLLTCTVAAWAHPRSPATPTAEAGACERVIGPAHDYCTRRAPAPATTADRAAPTAAGPALATRAALVPAALGGRTGMLLFSTAAIGGAIGLLLISERRMR